MTTGLALISLALTLTMCLICSPGSPPRHFGRSFRGILMSAPTIVDSILPDALQPTVLGGGPRSLLRRRRLAQPSAIRKPDRDRNGAACHHDWAIGGVQDDLAHPCRSAALGAARPDRGARAELGGARTA